MEYVIEATKTSSGTRQIPMTDEVALYYKKIIANRIKIKTEPMVSGKCGLLYSCNYVKKPSSTNIQFTTFFTTFEGKSMPEYEKKCEKQ